MSSTWNIEKTLSLIEDVRNNPCLWDITSPYYKHRNKKFAIYEELGKKYSMASSDIEKKVQSLRSQFRREHRKVKHSEKTMKHKCNWFGYKPLGFLLNNNPCGTDEGNEKNIYDSADVKIKSDMIENSVEDNSEVDYNESIDSQSQTVTEKCVLQTELRGLENGTLQCIKTLIDVVTNRDEYSAYGDYVADKLRKSGKSNTEIHIAQHHIDNIAFNLVMGVYGQGATGGAGINNTVGTGSPNLAFKEEEL